MGYAKAIGAYKLQGFEIQIFPSDNFNFLPDSTNPVIKSSWKPYVFLKTGLTFQYY